MKQAQQFISSLAEQISMPAVYYDIRRLIKQENSTTEDFVEVIESDSVLNSRLMRIAGSPYFGFPLRAGSLSQAINQFGLIQLHDLVLCCLALRTFATIPQQIFNLEAFWRYSIENGIAARTLAQYGQIMPINPYFTLGLMHDIGHAAIYIKEPELAMRAAEQLVDSNRPLVQLEQELLGFDYTQVGTELMKLWGLPGLYQQVTACHLNPALADERFRQSVSIVQLAHTYCQQPQTDEWKELLRRAVENDQRLLQLPTSIETIIEKEISDNTDLLLTMLWPNTTSLNLDGVEHVNE